MAVAGLALGPQEWQSGKVWPEPKLVDPGPPGGVPADAIVLFDGKDMSDWKGGDNWIDQRRRRDREPSEVEPGYAETKQPFGDCQLHVEWAAPEKVEGDGQGRGNSGVYLMGRYEVQILDSYNNTTYFDGQAAADLQAAPAAGERLPQAGRVADLRHRVRSPAIRRRASSRSRPTSPCCRTACWCRTTSNWRAAPPGTRPPKYTAHAAGASAATGSRQSGPFPQHLDSGINPPDLYLEGFGKSARERQPGKPAENCSGLSLEKCYNKVRCHHCHPPHRFAMKRLASPSHCTLPRQPRWRCLSF